MGRLAMVTGASGGIGRAIVAQLVVRGWSVFAGDTALVDHQDLGLGFTASASIRVRHLDVRDPGSIDRVVDAAVATGELVGVVNCAGILRTTPIGGFGDEEMMEMLLVNLAGVARVCRAATPHLGRGASIVNIGSIAASKGYAGTAVYAATKAGVEGFTRVLACELASSGVRANVVAPGFIRVPMSEAMRQVAGGSEDVAPGQVPCGRMGDPREIAEIVEFLLSDRSTYMTGAVVTADGGVSAR